MCPCFARVLKVPAPLSMGRPSTEQVVPVTTWVHGMGISMFVRENKIQSNYKFPCNYFVLSSNL